MIRCERIHFRCCENRRLRFGKIVVERQNWTPAAALQRSRAIMFMGEEMLQRSEEKGAQPALLPIRAAQGFVFHEMDEERLRQVLRIVRRIAAIAQKSIEWRPISLAEIRQRALGRFRGFRIRGELNHAPMRRSKRSPSFLQRSRNRFHKRSDVRRRNW